MSICILTLVELIVVVEMIVSNFLFSLYHQSMGTICYLVAVTNL